MNNTRILLIVGGGIAAYKSCELIRLLRGAGASVTCVLTEGGAKFITALTLAALSENHVHTTLWDLKNETEMGLPRRSCQQEKTARVHWQGPSGRGRCRRFLGPEPVSKLGCVRSRCS